MGCSAVNNGTWAKPLMVCGAAVLVQFLAVSMTRQSGAQDARQATFFVTGDTVEAVRQSGAPDAANAQLAFHRTASASSWSENSMPEWVTRGNYVDNDGAQIIVVSSEAFGRQADARRDLRERIKETVRQVLSRQIAPGAGAAVGLSDERTESLIVGERPFLQVQTIQALPDQDVSLYSFYAQVKVDEPFLEWASGQWERELVRSRLLQTVLVGGGVVLLLGIAFAYCQMDKATRGFYAGRLQTTALALILVLLALAVAASKTFEWF